MQFFSFNTGSLLFSSLSPLFGMLEEGTYRVIRLISIKFSYLKKGVESNTFQLNFMLVLSTYQIPKNEKIFQKMFVHTKH